MAKRFGRNQRRRAREAIEKLAAEKRWVEIQRDGARHEAANARQQALEMFMERHELYKYAVGECSYALGRALADELNQHKEKLLSMLVRERPLLKFEFRKDFNAAAATMDILHVHIPLRELHYQQIVG